uniref:NADH dehydrogenase subunit 6 n=1 Tax=Haloa japonica TaxID=674295 RepID=A0A7S6VHD7_9GAST|nr:NADH dehydrogenase subunit 6 [Haloa japonica]QOW38681.1 NADH dehydrogenase subunit 6 [Haloa japonica]
MKFLIWLCLSLLVSFPLYSWPISLGAVLILLSLSFVSIMSLAGSWWYSYILFLVYIGGLLVMFIYVCLISSNYTFFSSNSFVGLLAVSFILSYLVSIKPLSKSFLGASLFDAGENLVCDSNLWMFGGLVILLLVMMLIVVRSSGSGAITVK